MTFTCFFGIISGGCCCSGKYHLTSAISEGVLSSKAPRRLSAKKYSTITCARKTEHEEKASILRDDTGDLFVLCICVLICSLRVYCI